MKKTLFDIKESYVSLANEIMINDGVLSDELESSLNIVYEELEEKSINYCKLIKHTEGENKIIDDEIKRLSALKKNRNSLITILKDRISNALKLFDMDKVETPLYKISFRKSTSVEIEDIELLPNEAVIIEKKVSKTVLKEMMKIGDVEGAKLVINFNLQIK